MELEKVKANLKKLQAERTLLRRAFTKAANKLQPLLEDSEGNAAQLRVQFNIFSDKATRLFRVDEQVRELLFIITDNETEFDKEFEETEEYRDKYTALMAEKEYFDSENDKVTSIDSSESNKKTKHMKLPKLIPKKFDGSLKNWISFWAMFKRIHESADFDAEEKFQYLLLYTVEKSPAREIVESFPPSEGNYVKVINKLKERYGRDDLLIELYVRELLKLVLIQAKGQQKLSLRELYDRIETQLRALETLGVTTDKYTYMITPLIESALPEDILREWERRRNVNFDSTDSVLNISVKMQQLLDFLKREVESEERLTLAHAAFSESTTISDKRTNRNKEIRKNSKDKITTATELVNVKPVKTCIFCENGNHTSENCLTARKKTIEENEKVIKEKRVCFICLKPGHSRRFCRVTVKCIICNGRHFPLFCPTRKNLEQPVFQENNDKGSEKVEHSLSNTSESPVVLQTIMVKLKGEKEVKVRALFDTGSQRSYLTKRLAKEMGYNPTQEVKLEHALFGGAVSAPKIHFCYKVHLQSLDGEYNCNFDVLDTETICQAVPSFSRSNWFSELKEKGIVLSDYSGGHIDLLIGADVYGKLMTGTKCELSCGLVAFRTLLGWSVMGKIKESNQNYLSNISMFSSDFSVEELWKLDCIGIEDSAAVKSREEKVLEAKVHFEETVDILDDGRYEVRLPWKEDHPPLTNNFDMALKRLQSTVKKMKMTSVSLIKRYDQVFAQWLSEGIIERVFTETYEKGHYLPHRPVIKESATTKVRPVFDASAKVKGAPSLNQCLEKGPNLIECIPSLLLRFRLERFGVISDVKQAFLQISVHEQDRDYLRFLWYDEENNLIVFRHKRVVFGVSSSPFLLGAVFEHLLDRHEGLYKPDAANYSLGTIQKLRKSLYVDNCVASLPSEESLKLFIKESIFIFDQGKFNLRGWEYSDPELPEPTNTAVLGLRWDRKYDSLKINIPIIAITEHETLTRRTLLSLVQKIFDPIGLTAPATLIPKLMIQKTWLTGGSWDDEVSREIQEGFREWTREIPYLDDIIVPRWIVGVEREEANISLHTFCDASKMAYAAVCFLRVEWQGLITIHLVSAKARVAPVKKCTIPRLELLAALIGARLAKDIRKELNEQFDNYICYYWSDSSTALAWIKRQENWGVFVHNRVKEITTLTRKEEWQHVPGSQNPADLASRGCNPRLLGQTKWWEGPKWLKLPEDQWPYSQVTFDEEEILREQKKSVTIGLSDLNHESLSARLVHSFKSYIRIVRTVGWIVRFYRRSIKKEVQNEALTYPEIEEAERRLLRLVQNETFQGAQDQKFSKLKISIDNFGLMRVKTKISTRKDAEDFKAPIVLPATHPITECLIMEKHLESNHQRGQGLLNFLRERFWILRGRIIIRKILKGCTICQRFDSKPFAVDSPPLPENRVRDARVFEVCGTDLAGPLYLKNDTKVWVCIFTCAIYRAVHFEVVCSLSTEHFMMAFRRFIARRGRPRVIYSDNATNFKGMHSLLKKVDWKKISAYSCVRQIEWRFNPPSAPWWGGFWERLIGVMKRLLRKIIGKSSLSGEELNTIISECESIINNRPVTYVSEDPEDPIPITPNMFLRDIEEDGIPDLEAVDSQVMGRRLKYRRRIKEELRKRFRVEYLGQLKMSANVKETRKPKIGEIVLVGSEGLKRMDWPLAIVEQLIPGQDGENRVVILRTAEGKLCRPIQRLFPLEIFHDEGQNTSHALEEEPVEKISMTSELEKKETVTRCGRRVRLPPKLLC